MVAVAAERKFYNSKAWRKTRQAVIARDDGLCVICRSHGVVTVGKEVDHIKPLKARPDLGLALDNLRLLCHDCHSRVTARARRPSLCNHGYIEGTCPTCRDAAE